MMRRRVATAAAVVFVLGCGRFQGTEDGVDAQQAGIDGGALDDAGGGDGAATPSQQAGSACATPCDTGQACDHGTCVATQCDAADEQAVILRPNGMITQSAVYKVVPTTSTFDGALAEPGKGDGDQSYLAYAKPARGPWLDFSKDKWSLPAERRISRVFVRARARSEQGKSPGVLLGLYYPDADPKDPHVNDGAQKVGASYTLVTYEQGRYPVGDSSAWTAENLSGVGLSIQVDPAATADVVRITQLWLEVCHLPR